MRLFYDFHIHTALSPCSDYDMTPNNIVNMAKIKGLDVIAITDHNSCGNVLACMEVGEKTGLIVLPGMEIESMEAIHCICLFPSMDSALEMEREVRSRLPYIKNRPEIFGRQIYFNSLDLEVKDEELLLLNSCDLSVFEIKSKAESLGGVFYPAHIDRDSYSILSSLGAIPKELSQKIVEISKEAHRDFIERYINDYMVVYSSDAHYLQDIFERQNYLEVKTNNPHSVISSLRQYV